MVPVGVSRPPHQEGALVLGSEYTARGQYLSSTHNCLTAARQGRGRCYSTHHASKRLPEVPLLRTETSISFLLEGQVSPSTHRSVGAGGRRRQESRPSNPQHWSPHPALLCSPPASLAVRIESSALAFTLSAQVRKCLYQFIVFSFKIRGDKTGVHGNTGATVYLQTLVLSQMR